MGALAIEHLPSKGYPTERNTSFLINDDRSSTTFTAHVVASHATISCSVFNLPHHLARFRSSCRVKRSAPRSDSSSAASEPTLHHCPESRKISDP